LEVQLDEMDEDEKDHPLEKKNCQDHFSLDDETHNHEFRFTE